MASTTEQEKELLRQLEQLECHIKWKPADGGSLRGGQNELTDHLLRDIEDCPFLAVELYSLIAYIYTFSSEGKYMDLGKAKEYAELALSEANKAPMYTSSIQIYPDRCFVPKALLAHIYYMELDLEKCEALLRDLNEQWEVKTEVTLAFVKGVHAQALTKFGPKNGKYTKALDLFREAKHLDKDCPWYPYGIGITLGRLRRQKKEYKPCDEETGAFDLAYKLSGETNPVIMINLAASLRNKCDFEPNIQNVEMNVRHFRLALQAKELGKNSVHVLNLCDSYFFAQKRAMLGYQKDCLEKAVKLPRDNYVSLGKLGRFHLRNAGYKDIPKAKELLERSFKEAPGENYFYGEVDYVQLRRLYDGDWDLIQHCRRMIDKYSLPEDKGRIFLEMGVFLWKTKRDHKQAINFLKQSLTISPEQPNQTFYKGCRQSAADLLLLLADELSGSEKLFLKAWTFQTMNPPNLEEARCSYEKLLDQESSNNEVEINLSQVYDKLGQFDKAVTLLDKLPDDVPEKINKLARIKLQRARKLVECPGDAEQALDLYLACVRLGCHDALRPALHLLGHMCPVTMTQEQYERFADIAINCDRTDAFSVQNHPYKYRLTRAEVDVVVRTLLEQSVSPTARNLLGDLRQLRWDMTVHQGQAEKIRLVLTSARDPLDRCTQAMFKKHFFQCKCPPNTQELCRCIEKSSAHFPYKFTDESELKQLLGKKNLPNFHFRFPDLFNFLLQNSAANKPELYSWIPAWCEMVNKHKHDNPLPVNDTKGMYSLAHKAADFTEKMVEKFCDFL